MKIWKYNPHQPLKTLYESYESITLWERCPWIQGNLTIECLDMYYKQKFFQQFDRIITSWALRWKQTANLIKEYYNLDIDIQVDERLNEIVFSLQSLVTYDEFTKEKSISVRRNFIQNLTKNNFKEKHDSILKRRNIFDEYEDKTLFISHSFFMKIEEIIRASKKLPQDALCDRELFIKNIPIEKKTFNFCEWFELL